MKEAYIRFIAPVDPRTTASLFQIFDKKLKEKVERIHLMLSSPGGMVFHGLSIYNFLKGAPIEIYTYNFGQVDSIGVVIFCSGSKRFSVPHARFLIHGVQANFMGNQSLDEKDLEERLKGLQIDYKNIARVIADTAQKPFDKVLSDMNNRTTLNPQEAKDYGLVHEIKSELFPIDADLSVIGEIPQVAQPMQFPLPILGPGQQIQVQHLTTPLVGGITKSDSLHHGTYFVS
ncbi:MAG: ATP-dependent Clp protease proteolytic subunit [Sedimentisphaerales bacterium]|jgi:ATP-dependent protease ClpP protease subunit